MGAVLLALAGVGLSTELTAQARRDVAAARLDSLGPRFDRFAPRSGSPGTIVTLRVDDLPVEAPLRIGVGALHLGFEEVGWVMSDEDGAFIFVLEIPAWASHERAHFFIVFDPYFAPIAVSTAFHVTGPNGLVRRTGRVTGIGGACPALAAADGVTYSLGGDLSPVADQDSVVVEGTFGLVGCSGRPAIVVSRLSTG